MRQSSGLLFNRRPRSADEPAGLGLSCPWHRGPAGRRRRMGDGSRPIHRPWTLASQPAGDGRAGVVGDDRGRPRSDRGATRQSAACPGRGRARDLRDGRRDRPRGGADAGSQISRRPYRVAGVLDGLHACAHGVAASRADRRPGDSLRPPGIAVVRRRCVLHQPDRHRGQRAGSSRPVGVRYFR